MRSENDRAHAKTERKISRPSIVIGTGHEQNVKRKRRVIEALVSKDYTNVKAMVRLTDYEGFCELVVDIEEDDRITEERHRIDDEVQTFELNDIEAGSVVFVSVDTDGLIDRAFVTLTGK